jgi:hypothetical protein
MNKPSTSPRKPGWSRARRSAGCGGLVLWLLVGMAAAQAQQVKDCAFAPKTQQLARRVRTYAAQRQALEDSIAAYRLRQTDPNFRTQARLLRIPVVVHVVHNNANGNVGGTNNGNISDEQIRSQMQVLNEDYRRVPGTNGFNTNPVGTDMEIEFFLATRDPDGNPSTGITRHYHPQATFSIFTDDGLLASIAYWPSDRYLNIWVTSLQGNVLGYAQFPSVAGIEGLDQSTESLARTDGVFIDHPAFGRRTGTANSGIYRDGRTATHEIGHWLGLIHTWGDDFCGNDYCADTPPAEAANRTVECRETFSTCNGARSRNMIENFLDLSPDLCMNTFTENQKTRVRAVLDLAPRRRTLIFASNPVPDSENLVARVYPNPTAGTDLEIEVRFSGLQDVDLELFTLQGVSLSQRAYSAQPSSVFRFPLNDLPNGVYLLRVGVTGQTAVRRVMLFR